MECYFEWLKNYQIKNSLPGLDILDSDLVDAFCEAFNVTPKYTYWGANKCKKLGNILSVASKTGHAKKSIISLSGAWQPGFPKWVYTYNFL